MVAVPGKHISTATGPDDLGYPGQMGHFLSWSLGYPGQLKLENHPLAHCLACSLIKLKHFIAIGYILFTVKGLANLALCTLQHVFTNRILSFSLGHLYNNYGTKKVAN